MKVKMWALWNFDNLLTVKMLRCDARAYAYELFDKERADRMFKSGMFRVGKVIITEARS
ncbi:MAG TPA: hypothetical protein VG328_17975 [Stellaceae bacterium]|jgi:hypothetical protein|nr:hypothetical protein [Stellaceae bacterium]